MANYVYPHTMVYVNAVALGADELAEALRVDDAGFELGAIPLISETTGETVAIIAWDDDGHAVVEWQ